MAAMMASFIKPPLNLVLSIKLKLLLGQQLLSFERKQPELYYCVMNKNLAERLKESRKKAGFTQHQLGQKVGVSQAAIQKIEKGKSVSSSVLPQIANILNVNAMWLATGVNDSTDIKIPEAEGLEKIDTWCASSPLPADEAEVPLLKDIELAAGEGWTTDKQYNGQVLRFSKLTLRKVGACSDGSGVFCFPAKGNSMEPVIPSGATVAVNTLEKKIIDGEIYAIDQGGLKRIKQVYRKPGGKLILRSFNREEFQDEEAFEKDVDIIGFVFWYSVLRYRN